MNKKNSRILLFIVIACVTVLSLIPLQNLRIEAPSATDKAVHVIMYFAISTLALWSYSTSKTQSILTIVLIVIAYSILIELLQEFTPLKRSGEIYDVVANSIGTFLGIISQPVLKKIEKSFA